MKYIILSLLILYTLSYNPQKAIEYAKKYCRNYNDLYKNYKNYGCDCSNFVSQCLIAGGLDISNCIGLDEKGGIPKTTNLKACLTQKGWKSRVGKPNSFKPGYPFFKGDMHARIATGMDGNYVIYCDHKCEDTCNGRINDDTLIYYYL